MWLFLLSVVAISLSGTITPGLLFTVTVARSGRSPFAGAWLALGHALVEVPLALLIYFGFARFFQQTPVQVVISLIGGAVMVWMGVNTMRSKAGQPASGPAPSYNALTGGALASLFNPFFLLWWTTVGAMLIMKSAGYGTPVVLLVITVHWLCDLVWYSLVSAVIYRTHSLWGKGFQQTLFVLCGLVLLGYGGWFLFSGARLAF